MDKELYNRIMFCMMFLFGCYFISDAQNYNCLTAFSDSEFLRSLEGNGGCVSQENGLWSVYRDMNLYIPYMDSMVAFHNAPIKTIQVNVNIIQKDDGTGNFEDNYETYTRFRQIFTWINNIYSNYASSDPINWVTELPNYDSRIRFSIGDVDYERIYFYQNTSWWGSEDNRPIIQYMSTAYPERLKAVNVFIYRNPNLGENSANAFTPSWNNFNYNQTVKCRYWLQESDWGQACLLAHEFAHLLDLRHTYEGGGASAICDQNDPDFLKDVFVTTLPDISNCPHSCSFHVDPYGFNGDGYTNNIVGGSNSEFYISPMQAGQMHRAFL